MTNLTPTTSNVNEADYDALRAAMKAHVDAIVAARQPLVIANIDAKRLFLDAMPNAAMRQHYNCSACKHFLESHGGLAVVGEDGTLSSALFPSWDFGELSGPVEALRFAISNAGVRRAPPQETLAGRPSTKDAKRGKEWSHLHASGLNISLPPHEARDRFIMFQRGLKDYPATTLEQAHRLLTSGNIPQSERHAEMCGWLLDLARKTEVGSLRSRNNLLWRAAVSCPPGYANFRGGALGALLEEVKSGKPFEAIRRRFETVMDPLKYQRQQSVSEGQLEAAEKRIAELGIASSLRRRKATLADLQPFWALPAAPAATPTGAGVFGHVKPTGGQASMQPTIQQPVVSVTWAKFARGILPNAKAIEVLAPNHGGYFQFTTAADKTSPIIHQWPNHEAFYTYNGGASASRFGIQAGRQLVVALVRSPHEWAGSTLPHHRKNVFFVIAGCGDMKNEQGCALFPSDLKSYLHAVRAAIEAYSKQTPFEPHEGQAAAGLSFSEGRPLSVYVDGQGYTIDRWE